MKKLLYISLLAPLAAMAQQPKDSITQLEEVVVKAEAPIKRIQKAAYNVVAIEAQPLQAVNSNAADILARVSGVKMRETGGVGAEANINLNGFTGRHVRTFIDGVPMNGMPLSAQPFTSSTPLYSTSQKRLSSKKSARHTRYRKNLSLVITQKKATNN